MIQIAKRTLPFIGLRRLSFEILLTIMVETESSLNSRPLTNVAEQCNKEEPLTPNHFVIQRPSIACQRGQLGDQQPACPNTWKLRGN